MNLENALNLEIISAESLEDSIYQIRKTFNIPLTVPDEMIYVVILNDIISRYFDPEWVSEEVVNELMGEWG